MYVFNLAGFQPIEDSLHFVFSHAESVGHQDVSEVFHTVLVKLAFSGVCVEAMFPEPAEDFFDVLFVLRHVVGVDEDVVEVDDDTDIEEVAEDVVHETLKGRGCVGKSEGHHQPFKRAVASAEGGLPFFTFCDVNKVVCVTKVDFGIGAGFPRGVEEVGDERKGISVFLGDLVEPAVVNAQSKASVFFPHEEDRSSVRRIGGPNKAAPNVLFNERSERVKFRWREGVHATRWRSLAFFKVDLEVIGTMFGECFRFALAEDVGEFMIVFGNTGQVNWFSDGGRGFAG